VGSPPAKPVGDPRPWIAARVAVYHITHVDNLASIMESGGLDCDNGCAQAGRVPVSIAYSSLKEQRARTAVGVAAGGTLADYVPFYYAPRSPMLHTIWRGNVTEYDGPQDEIMHLVCDVESLAMPGRFVIINRHPITALAEQFDDLSALDDLDWPLMKAIMWRDTDADGDRKFRRQAEFLVHQHVSIEAIRTVGAMTDTIAARAATVLAALPNPPPVFRRRDWYY
jgi:ssDNA thymidine ADP-ribosyltransferase, DarT